MKVRERRATPLRRSRHLSFFRKKDEIYAYHDLWGYILQMDAKVHEFLEAFGEAGRPPLEVAREFCRARGKRPPAFRPEEAEGFVATFRQHRCLVGPRAEEVEEAFRAGYPSKAPWVVSWSPRPEEVVLSYKDRGLGRIVLDRLDPVMARVFHMADGEHTSAEIAERLAGELHDPGVTAEVLRFVTRFTHSDRQVLKLTDRPLYEYLAFPPPYLRSTMPYPRLEDAKGSEEAPPVVDLASYHRSEIADASAQFDVEETTLSHMFREPHEALGGKSYGAAFAEALVARGLLREAGGPKAGGAITVAEAGGGTGFFALRFLKALETAAPEVYGRVCYAIADLSQVLQDSQRMLNFELGGKVRYILANASRSLPFRDGSLDLLISNEVIADLATVRLHRGELSAGSGRRQAKAADPDLLDEARALIRRHGLPLDDAPEEFWLNFGALRLVEEVHRVLKPGGAAVLVEFGGENRYPVESTHLGHSEFSIHFGHVRHVALALGLEVELTDIMELLAMRGDVRVLATTRSSFECLRALLERRGVTLQKLAYTEKDLHGLLGDRLDPHALGGISFRPVRDRALGLHPPEFLVAILKKPVSGP